MDPPTRDEEYYFEDGSCILLVRDRLFNLHRTILSRNSAFFKQMFSLPQPAIGQSGQSDDDPILCDDPVDDFRSLCRILYPTGTLSEPRPKPRTFDGPDINRMAEIALIAHKYEFVKIENGVHRIISGSPFDANVVPPEDTSSIFEVALECAWEDVSARLATRLLGWIAKDTDEASLATASKLSFLLNVAERHNNISIQASAYYKYLGAINWDFELTVEKRIPSSVQVVADIPSTFYSLSSLNDAQKLCLFRGFAQLSSLQARLRIPPLFSHSDIECIARGHQGRCEKTIQETWKQMFIDCDTCIAPMEILDGPFVAVFMKTRISTDVPVECVQALTHKVIEIRRKIEHELPKYFGLC
ncbi:hypothetical protein AGABI1DRAFT_128667 [Agaricus bisporus var. burnettii JB137-S8]|uniref:BTB domain-containing protein n=1 Tax=Agaricus bisporus var. burnettii (strain JB137-S8 / ATCC MYA-4627 / FGSC 10392) TaxID=597362 RepID=K5X8H3_AGABU|nr:uncharacterized protein AGABI1DRAFT_128667 [Agaricus bisporus var. burnettii JB137-S8]EKM79518.1 hypothetical protein AGABI1DRAFT_128667 [Agaricus bisporus var. burnettii JB137-S8]